MSAGTYLGLCLSLLAVCVPLGSAVQTKTAESGKDVTLPCQAPHNNIIGVMWRKADLGEEYVYLNRRGHPQPQGQHPSFKNRVDLQDRHMKDGDVSLTLKNVTRNNTGTYECLVFEEETGSWKSLSNISLTVVDPPGQTGGDTEDGGKEDGGKEDGGKEDGGKEDGGKEDGGKEDGEKEDGEKEDGEKEDGEKEGGDGRGRPGLAVSLLCFCVVVCGCVCAPAAIKWLTNCCKKNSPFSPPSNNESDRETNQITLIICK
ncbi:unnamed protein product [Oreochromis niloticus]|nr:unnamed protein product [Mustela putorius furo]